MDVLADILSVTRLGGTVVAQAELVPPWGLELDPAAEAAMHVVQRGSCWLRLRGQEQPVAFGAGDVVLIRAGVGHSICDGPNTLPGPYREGAERADHPRDGREYLLFLVHGSPSLPGIGAR